MTKAQELGITEFPYREYDSNWNLTYYEEANGYWSKREYDDNENQTYYENSDEYWQKTEYDSNGNEIYWEDSEGAIIDNRRK